MTFLLKVGIAAIVAMFLYIGYCLTKIWEYAFILRYRKNAKNQ